MDILPKGIGNALRQYLRDAMPGGLLNSEVGGLLDPAVAGAKAQQGLLRDAFGDPSKMADATLSLLNNSAAGSFVPMGLGVGMTAWHGSPHKFDRFDLSKIGTGEGAQAYGHGLYLAESPEVAESYAKTLGEFRADQDTIAGRISKAFGNDGEVYTKGSRGIFDVAKKFASRVETVPNAKKYIFKDGSEIVDAPYGWEASSKMLYKTDIPDEAVARFLDWDKPLSQQAPEVQKALKPWSSGYISKLKAKYPNFSDEQIAEIVHPYESIRSGNGRGTLTAGDLDASSATSSYLHSLGIPGIRYLDGGSRGAGSGTSNFVVFDPEMIRILERNGEQTGLQPWAPGEWQGLLGASK